MDTTKTSINVELALSRNFDKVTIGIKDEPIDFSDADKRNNQIQSIVSILRNHCEQAFAQLESHEKNMPPSYQRVRK